MILTKNGRFICVTQAGTGAAAHLSEGTLDAVDGLVPGAGASGVLNLLQASPHLQ